MSETSCWYVELCPSRSGEPEKSLPCQFLVKYGNHYHRCNNKGTTMKRRHWRVENVSCVLCIRPAIRLAYIVYCRMTKLHIRQQMLVFCFYFSFIFFSLFLVVVIFALLRSFDVFESCSKTIKQCRAHLASTLYLSWSLPKWLFCLLS